MTYEPDQYTPNPNLYHLRPKRTRADADLCIHEAWFIGLLLLTLWTCGTILWKALA